MSLPSYKKLISKINTYIDNRVSKSKSSQKRIRNAALAVSFITLQILSPVSAFFILGRTVPAFAARTTNSATLDNSSSVTVAPGATISAAVNGTLTDGDDWDATEWRISATIPGTTTCADTSDSDSNGTYTKTFNITAPVTPGTYNAYFRVSGNSNCSSQAGSLVTLTNAVTVVAPPQADLTATKTSSVVGDATFNQPFTWKIRVQNSGTATASFIDNQDLLLDERPSTGVASYGTPVVTTSGTTGSFDCTQSGTNSRDLTCEANGAATMPVGSYVDIAFTATPNASGSLTNPRSGATCKADPGSNNGAIAESNENNNTCSNGVTVGPDTGVANPVLAQACGLDIALVLDNSTSIDADELAQMKLAMAAFTTAFTGTPTQFSVTKFATTAAMVQAFTGNITDVNTAINNIPVGGGFTNWQDGLTKAQGTLPNRPATPNLVIFASDGNPNRTGPAGTDVSESQAVADAKLVSDAIKTSGTRMLALGIGDGLDTPNLQTISGPLVNTGNVLTSDVITSNFAELAEDLAEFASQTCGGTITTTKLIDADGLANTTDDRTPAQNWTFDINGGSNPSATQTDVNGQTPAVAVDPGTYSVNETPQAGYELMSATCTGANNNGSTSLPNKNVTGIVVAANNIVACTFINKPVQPKLTLKKIAINDNGGTSLSGSFTLNAGTNNFTGGTSTVDPNDATKTSSSYDTGLGVGQYVLSEDSKINYSPVGTWSCTKGLSGSTVTLALGDEITCTITNDDDKPSLTLVKLLGDSMYGSTVTANDFNLTADGALNPSTDLSGKTGTASGNDFKADTYTLGESGPSGFNPSWNCVGGNSIVSQAIAITLGQTVTCTVTNNAIQPKLIVKKHVVTDNGGGKTAANFTMTVSGNSVVVPNFPGSEDGTEILLNVGNYTVDELADGGYTKSIGANCSGTIDLGETKTCIITNDDKQGTLTVNKVVVNDNSGTAQASDFSFTKTGDATSYNFVNGVNTLVGSKTLDVDAGSYSATENSFEGYTMTGNTCVDVEVTNGGTASCTITNDDVPHPSISVEKYGPDTAYEGDTVNYSFYVTNTGDTTLYNVNISDDIATNEVCDTTTLAKGVSTWCYATYTIPSPQVADVTNTVTACGDEFQEAEVQTPVCGTDTHILDVLHPSINVAKSGPTYGAPGEKVTYTFTVTNTGDVPLGGITVNDNIAGAGIYQSGDVNTNDVLETTETWIYTAGYTIPANQLKDVVNTAMACGYKYQLREESDNIQSLVILVDETPTPVCDSDSHTMSIPQVLAATTTPPPAPLVNTGNSRTELLTAIALINAILVVGALSLTRRRLLQK